MQQSEGVMACPSVRNDAKCRGFGIDDLVSRTEPTRGRAETDREGEHSASLDGRCRCAVGEHPSEVVGEVRGEWPEQRGAEHERRGQRR